MLYCTGLLHGTSIKIYLGCKQILNWFKFTFFGATCISQMILFDKSTVPQPGCLWHLSCGYTGRGPNLFLGRGLVYSGRFFWDTYFWDEVRGACLLWALFWDEGRRLVYSGRRQEAPPGTELGAVVSRLSSHPARPAAASASLRPTSTQPSPLGLNSTLYQVRFEAGLQICDAAATHTHPLTH